LEHNDTFRKKYSLSTIKQACKLLLINSGRNLDQIEGDHEEKEKTILSLFLVEFLKKASEVDVTRQSVALMSDKLKEFLFNEHTKVSSDQYRHVPVLVEDTELGNDIEVLLGVITGKKRVEPYNYVSFRVLHKLANLMSGDPLLANIDYLEKEDIEKQ
jgi:hypothetical protein